MIIIKQKNWELPMNVYSFVTTFHPPIFQYQQVKKSIKIAGKSNTEKDERKGTVQISMLWQEHGE